MKYSSVCAYCANCKQYQNGRCYGLLEFSKFDCPDNLPCKKCLDCERYILKDCKGFKHYDDKKCPLSVNYEWEIGGSNHGKPVK